ncbi:MAG TPA: outer membrane beta-barrel protein [Saprospiraceae bacterium]|nr:outer membrane beta-barrel protein [Saprospiraceae bacterium]
MAALRLFLLLSIFELSLCIILPHHNKLLSQDFSIDSLVDLNIYQNRYEYLLDDSYMVIGVNSAGIYSSNNFRNLSYAPGLSIGLEQLYPLGKNIVLNGGIHFIQKNFNFESSQTKINLSNIYFEIPATAALELPIFKDFDLRLLFGATAGLRIHSNVRGNYNQILVANPEAFVYNTIDYNRFDFGWHFGLGMEYKDYIFRIRSYSGFAKLDKKDQGMLNTFQFEVGYYLFRKKPQR